MKGVRVVRASENSKLGRVVATYRTQATCPSSCILRGNGCYAENPPMRWGVTQHVNLERVSSAKLFRYEAKQIDELTTTTPLRLGVVGDVPRKQDALTLSHAAERYQKRGGGPVWAYTRWWKRVPRTAWGKVSVLASCDSVHQLKAARAKGYAAAVIVPEFPSKKAWKQNGFTLIPCPSQTVGVTCEQCRLCMRDALLKRRKLAIAFEPHGAKKNTVKASVQRISLQTVS